MRRLTILLTLLPAPLVAQVAAPVSQAAAPADDPRLAALFEADQQDRAAGLAADPGTVATADLARRAEARAMLDAGRVRTGADYWHAAFLYQHGLTARDYLLAHLLAVTAVAKGKARARWIAAATLDRYLTTIGQPQVYGTQYRFPSGEPTTQEPYDRTLIGDDQRRAAVVEPLADQAAKLRQVEQERARALPGR